MIADAGEAAARVARTCKRIDAVAITVTASESERGVHVESCDECIVVEGDLRRLPASVLVDAALRCSATWVHPGYTTFERLLELSRAFVGSPSKLLASAEPTLTRAMDRRALRSVADEVHVRFIPGSADGFEKLADAIEAADALGYPVRLRLSQSGHTRSRRIADEDQLFATWDDMAKAAKDAGCTLMVEHEIELARRLDVLVVTDAHGECVAIAESEIALAEHDVGVDLDESPSPELINRPDGEAVRLAIFESAARFALPFALVGLATVRVVLDADGHFFVAGLRAGLPRHHPTIEMVSGLDFVALELRLHAGEPLPDEVHNVQPSGHAFGASLHTLDSEYENVVVKEHRAPPQPQRKVRFDPSFVDDAVPALADKGQLMRITTYAAIRHGAMLGLDRMLAEVDVPPFRTNAKGLRGVLADECFRSGQYDASLAERMRYPR